MSRVRRYELARVVSLCAGVWAGADSSALAQVAHAAEAGGSLGVGAAYLAGLLIGLVFFALRQALAVRKAHLAGLKK